LELQEIFKQSTEAFCLQLQEFFKQSINGKKISLEFQEFFKKINIRFFFMTTSRVFQTINKRFFLF
jgi:hypothetical protein